MIGLPNRMLALLCCALLAAVGVGCAGERSVHVSGTWVGHLKDVDPCPQCESWIGLDLHETSTGNVTGVYGDHTDGRIDFTIWAGYIVGSRAGDSLSLIVTMPCDSTWRPSTLGFRGRVSPQGDSLSGELSYHVTPRISGRIPIVLNRGPVDSSILAEFRTLKVACNAAA